MNENLAALEEAVRPYRERGYMITQQNEMSMTLVGPREPLNLVTLALLLIFFWPGGLIYLIANRNQGERAAFFRLTSDGKIEVSGYTLTALEAEERRQARSQKIWWTVAVVLIGLILLILLLVVLANRQ